MSLYKIYLQFSKPVLVNFLIEDKNYKLYQKIYLFIFHKLFKYIDSIFN